MKGIIITTLGSIVLIGLLAWVVHNRNEKASQIEAIVIEGIESFTDLGRKHVEEPVEYQQNPPVGGDHAPTWLACDAAFYDESVPKEQAVHSLEHGAVWISYKSSLDSIIIKQIEDKVSMLTYTFASPYEEQSSPVVLTAWGAQLAVESFNDPRVDQFLVKYRQSKEAPEPGATCQAIPEGMR